MRPRPFTFGCVAMLLLAAAPARPAPNDRVAVSLELDQHFYYAGGPLSLGITVRNNGDEKIKNPIRTPLLSGLKVKAAAGTALRPAGGEQAEEPARPEELAPHAFYGGTFDLVRLFPELGQVGIYEIYWSADGIVSPMLVVNIIPRYDPSTEYVGEIVTDLGSITVEFFQKQSPIAVKSFVDMAHAGLYDGLTFHEVHADGFVVGGDPRLAAPPRPIIDFPAEPSAIQLVAGTVVLKPVGAAPPANGPVFIILLRPQPAWAGQVTALGQVVRGLDVVQSISRVQSSLHRPLREIKIERVVIRPKPAVPPPS
jgi:peptidyl-prolyl cis-trans isomerase B (cyclophilin B)